MLRYIGKRILIAIPTFLGITVLVYVLSRPFQVLCKR